MHVHDLDAGIVARILDAACWPVSSAPVRLATYRRLVPLAGVCRAWRQPVAAHLAAVLIVEYQAPAGGTAAASPPAAAVAEPAAKARARAKWKGGGGKKSPPAADPAAAAVAAAASAGGRWRTNLDVLLCRAQPGAGVVRLRLQSFDAAPDYTQLVGALTADGLARCTLGGVHAIEIVDGSAAAAAAAAVRPGRTAAAEAECIAVAAAYLARAMPAVRTLGGPVWSVSAPSRALAGRLARRYFGQLQALRLAADDPGAADPGAAAAADPAAGLAPAPAALAALHIQADVLGRLGAGAVPAAGLQSLRLVDAGPFFSWAPFAGDAARPQDVDFERLATLAIEFATDDVVSIADFYTALGGSKYCVHVTMGRDRRRVALPALHTLVVRRVPYTYAEAWRMFAASPLRRLAVAGRHGHVRHIDRRLLHALDVLDVHTLATDGSGPGFTAYAKSLLAEPCAARSAWLRHSEAFPVSVPDAPGWTQLEELSLSAYVPALALLALVARLPRLRLLAVQRIARDADEAPLPEPPGARPWGHVTAPAAPASLSVRDLQLHLGGPALRVPTLQAICYLLLCMPRVRRLAVKRGYWEPIRAFAALHAATCPELGAVTFVTHVHMRAKSPFLAPG
ncbi:hypothetical protein H4R18_003691 [Coemansia javaensis]|uniref:Uncharacterized protein n=1 Tax=Coemansia javaensis TaxID=2761396 RepID=A0A9W8HBF1_9FUNG|nr:hypothetical protein H4R18_003691 [Coemansia javaensis]